MPVEQHHCESCGQTHTVCPECHKDMVTRREGLYQPTPNEVVDFGTEEDTVTYEHVCWNCGWTETVEMTVTRQ